MGIHKGFYKIVSSSKFVLANLSVMLNSSLGIIAGCIGNIRWRVAPVASERRARDES